jgi:uncharacterized protein (DUF342 family)
MFAEIQKRYKEFSEVLKSIEELKERFRLLLREFDKLRIEFASTAKKEDFENLEKKLTLAWKKPSNL